MRSHKSRIATEGSTPVVVRSSQDTSYRPYRALFRAPLPKTPFLSKLTPVTPWSHCQFFDFASAWITKRSRPLPSSYTVSTPPSFSTRSQTFCASLVQIAVTISPNPSPPRSIIPPPSRARSSLCAFTGSGPQSCLAPLRVSTVSGCHHYRPAFVVGTVFPQM